MAIHKPKLSLEVLNGPLDGAKITLVGDANWSKSGTGPLVFPWDDELGEPQAHFMVDETGWSLEGVSSPHGTYRVNKGERMTDKTSINTGDIIKASQTWLLVQKSE